MRLNYRQERSLILSMMILVTLKLIFQTASLLRIYWRSITRGMKTPQKLAQVSPTATND